MVYNLIRYVVLALVCAFIFGVSACTPANLAGSGDDAEIQSPTSTLEITPTTAMPLCTPPPCGTGEVYFCQDECPGGCGTTCATHTPPPLSEDTSANTASSSRLTSVQTFPNQKDYTWEKIVAGLEKPLALAHAMDGTGRLFIVEQSGVILVIMDGHTLPGPFLDIQSRVEDGKNEQGLLGLAFHPDYASNGFFFVNYTGAGGDSIISRFSVSSEINLADPGTETVLMHIKQPYANHNGGGLAFGPDGYLYIGLGDGGLAGDPENYAQDPGSLLGKMLRIDVDHGNPYAVPGDNPYAFGDGRPEIWALGLRNPWRYSFDRETGDLYIGDVGQNQWEEINHLAISDLNSSTVINFGWDFWEGYHPYEGTPPDGVAMVEPIWEYPHSQGCSVTGGEVYRGKMAEWQGIYLYGDYCTGAIWGLLQNNQGEWVNSILFQTGTNISSFGSNEQGEVYYADHKGGVYQLVKNK